MVNSGHFLDEGYIMKATRIMLHSLVVPSRPLTFNGRG